MARLLATLTMLLVFSAAAFAGPTLPPRAEGGPPRQHRYWLSQDFQRLVFWQAPTQQQAGARR